MRKSLNARAVAHSPHISEHAVAGLNTKDDSLLHGIETPLSTYKFLDAIFGDA